MNKYEKLAETKANIQKQQGKLCEQDLLKALSKRGWSLSDYRELFPSIDDLMIFLNS